MSQSLASLLKARDSLSRSNVIQDQSLNVVEHIGDQPSNNAEHHLFREEEKFIPFIGERELSLSSSNVIQDQSLNVVEHIEDQPSNNVEHHLFREEEKFIPFIEERELVGTSEMVNVHDSDISIPDNNQATVNKDQSESVGSLTSDIIEIISPSISTEINSMNVISLKLQSQERENVTLKLNAQKLLDQITSMERKMNTQASIQSELASTIAQSDILKLNSKREKEEHKVSVQKLSLELTYLKTTKEEGITRNFIVEQRCNTLETEKRDLLQQIESQKFQLTENASSISSLDRAERHISQLESENKLFHQLSKDLDASDRDRAQIRRRATILENEITNLKAENLQLQRNLHKKNSTSNESVRSSGQYSPPAPPQLPQFRNNQDFYSNRVEDSNITEDNQRRETSHQSLNSFTDSSNHQKQQRLAVPSWSPTSQSASIQQRNINANSNFVKDSIINSGNNPYKDNSSSSTSRSLANFIGNKEYTLSSGDSNGSNIASEQTQPRGLNTSRNGNDMNNKDSHSMNNIRGHSPSPTSSTDPSLVERNRFNSSSKIKGGTSSGGGVSCLYNEDMNDTPNNSVYRAPFGTDQSKAIDMSSFDDADNRLTVLMTEKSVLYEESARLQQKGGKVLKERTRLQQVDARLIEVGKEIAYERKILTGKPA